MANLTTLNSLLSKVARYHPHYNDRLATHLPMVLIALKRLNAADSTLEITFDKSIKDLNLVGSLDNVVPIEDITDYLGDSSKYLCYLKYFITQLNSHGVENVLKKSLPILISGVAASAFHALIRLAYAMEENNENEIAIALAFWSSEFQLITISEEKSCATAEETLKKLAPLGEEHHFSPGIIADRIDEIGKLLKSNGCIIQPETISYDELRKLALRIFYNTDDFTLLHTVTACHAFSIIMPYLKDKELALRELWKAILTAYLSTGLGYKTTRSVFLEVDCDFSILINDAIKSYDSHTVKLVYSCFCEYLKYKDPMYYLVAKRAVFES